MAYSPVSVFNEAQHSFDGLLEALHQLSIDEVIIAQNQTILVGAPLGAIAVTGDLTVAGAAREHEYRHGHYRLDLRHVAIAERRLQHRFVLDRLHGGIRGSAARRDGRRDRQDRNRIYGTSRFHHHLQRDADCRRSVHRDSDGAVR